MGMPIMKLDYLFNISLVAMKEPIAMLTSSVSLNPSFFNILCHCYVDIYRLRIYFLEGSISPRFGGGSMIVLKL